MLEVSWDDHQQLQNLFITIKSIPQSVVRDIVYNHNYMLDKSWRETSCKPKIIQLIEIKNKKGAQADRIFEWLKKGKNNMLLDNKNYQKSTQLIR